MEEVLVQLESERELRKVLEAKLDRSRQRLLAALPTQQAATARAADAEATEACELRADAERLRAKLSADTARFRDELADAEGRIHCLRRELTAARKAQDAVAEDRQATTRELQARLERAEAAATAGA